MGRIGVRKVIVGRVGRVGRVGKRKVGWLVGWLGSLLVS